MSALKSMMIFYFLLLGCAQKPPTKALESRANEKLKNQSRLSELEKQKVELELRNKILVDALRDRQSKVVKTPNGKVVQPFPEFQELIYEQGSLAFKTKDVERLTEAVRILKSNHPKSKYLESMFFWLAQLRQERAEYTKALVIYDEFLKLYPASEYASLATFHKGQIYEKLNLNSQAMKIYELVRKKFPDSRERHFADSKIEAMKRVQK